MTDALQRMPADRLRLTLVTWVGVYPTLTALALVLDPILGDAPTPVRTLFTRLLMVPLMTLVVMPGATRALNFVLRARSHEQSADV